MRTRTREVKNGKLWCRLCSSWLLPENFGRTIKKRPTKTYIYPNTSCIKCTSTARRPKIKEWVNNNRARVNEMNCIARRNLRKEATIAYGSKCVCCDETCCEFLTIEHVTGHATKKIQIHMELARLKKAGWPTHDIQLLCFNCNSARGIYGTCPHTWAPGEVHKPLSVKQRNKLYSEARHEQNSLLRRR